MLIFIAKLIKTFISTLMMYLSRKLIYYIDDYFSSKIMQDTPTITCDYCGFSFDKDIVKFIDSELGLEIFDNNNVERERIVKEYIKKEEV